MAISGGSYRVENDLQQSFKTNMDNQNETVSGITEGYSSSNRKWFNENKNPIVGITPEMLPKITNAIDEYISNLTTTLEGMPTAVDYTQAFKGEGITKAVETFVTSVKDVCKSYLDALKNAENQIVESVNAQYQASDSDLAGQLNSDASSIRN